MPDGSCVMFKLKTLVFVPGSSNEPPPPKPMPGRGWPWASEAVWQIPHVAIVTRYLPRSTGVDAACDGCGVISGLGIVLTMYSSGPGSCLVGTTFFTAGIVRR